MTPASVYAAPKNRKNSDYTDIDAYVAMQMKGMKIPGMALGIVQGNRIVHLHGFGKADETGRPVTVKTPFRIGSITKSFTALAVMQLVEAGKIDLDEPVQTYLPWFHVADEKASAKITVRQLLTQTSGFSTLSGNDFWDSKDGLEAAVKNLHKVELTQPVGARFQYSNINYSIAGLIVEKASRQSLAEYFSKRIFSPLAMRHSHIDPASASADGQAMGHLHSLGHMYPDAGVAPPAYLPAGFVSASVEDMSHYAVAQLNNGRYLNSSVLSKNGVAQLHHPAAPFRQNRAGTKDNYYGMGWVIGSVDNLPVIWHNGDTGRFHATLIMAPERSLAVILLANASGFEYLFEVDEIAKGVLNLLDGQAPPEPPLSHAFYRITYWGILLLPLLFMLSIARGWRHWRRGDFSALAKLPHSRRRQMWRILWMLVPNLSVAAFFLVGMPKLTGLPHSAIRILYPDLGYALMAGIAFGIAWSAVYTAMVLQARVRSA